MMMKTSKTRIGCTAVFLLFMAGCDDRTDKNIEELSSVDVNNVEDIGKSDEAHTDILEIESTGDIIIDIHDGNDKDKYEPFRMLNDSDRFEEVKGVLDNAEWENAEVSMSRAGDFRFETIDNRDKEKRVSTTYYLWVSPEGEKVELVDEGRALYVQLSDSESEKLYKLLMGKNLSDHMASTAQVTDERNEEIKKEIYNEDLIELGKKQNELSEDLNADLKKINIGIDFIFAVGDMYYEESQLVIMLIDETDKRNIENLDNVRRIVKKKVQENSDGYRLVSTQFSRWEVEDIMSSVLGSPITLSKNTVISHNTIENRVDILTDGMSEKDISYINKKYGSSVLITIDPEYENNVTPY